MDGVGIVRNADTVASQLFAKAYRPRAGNQGGFAKRSKPLCQILGTVDGRLPGPFPVVVIESGEDLAPPAVEDGKGLAAFRLLDSAAEGVERADAPDRQAEADAEAAGRRDPDPDPGEGTGTEADREQVHRLPAARRSGRTLDLLEQAGRVPGPPLRGEAQLRLVRYLAVAPGAGDGVNRRGIEADDDQRGAIP
jgi:hypothetical protein